MVEIVIAILIWEFIVRPFTLSFFYKIRWDKWKVKLNKLKWWK
jgi:hypothetical protein